MPDLSADLDLTIATLQQDLSTVAPEDAIAIVDNWQAHYLRTRSSGGSRATQASDWQ